MLSSVCTWSHPLTSAVLPPGLDVISCCSGRRSPWMHAASLRGTSFPSKCRGSHKVPNCGPHGHCGLHINSGHLMTMAIHRRACFGWEGGLRVNGLVSLNCQVRFEVCWSLLDGLSDVWWIWMSGKKGCGRSHNMRTQQKKQLSHEIKSNTISIYFNRF